MEIRKQLLSILNPRSLSNAQGDENALQVWMVVGVNGTGKTTTIGKLAASQVQAGQTVMVDSGTTTLEVARNLPKDKDITVATTSIWVA